MPISNKTSADSKPADHSMYSGMRKLIRPTLALHARRHDPSHNEDPLSHAMLSDTHGVPNSSHAETFYFQKQVQQQTEMTVVLDDGEEIHGVIQWFDQSAIKIRAGRQRILVYKSAIKYLYKAAENNAGESIMK